MSIKETRILLAGIEGQGDGDLLALRQARAWRCLNGNDLEKYRSGLERPASLKVRGVHPVDGVQHRGGLERRALQAMNHLMRELLVELFL